MFRTSLFLLLNNEPEAWTKIVIRHSYENEYVKLDLLVDMNLNQTLRWDARNQIQYPKSIMNKNGSLKTV